MDLRNLQTFIQVAELGSFTRAGEKLGYSQPTVSFQIKQLEREMGIQLFDRVGHTVRVTDEGQNALTYAQHIWHMTQEMTERTAARQTPSGIVRLAMADSLCAPLLLGSFQQFRTAYPQVSVRITAAGTDEMFRLLEHNEVDLVCVLDSHIYNSAYIIAHEEQVGIHFVAPPDHPLAGRHSIRLQELVRFPMLLTEHGMSYGRLLHEMLARESLEVQPVLETGRTDVLCRLVEEGMGLSLLPDYVTEEAVQAGRLVHLPVKGVKLELWKQVLYHRGKWRSLQMEAVINHLSRCLLSPQGR